MKNIVGLLMVTVLCVSSSAAQSTIRTEKVQLAKGTSSKEIQSHIQGDDTIDYVVRAGAGQSMKVALQTSNKSAYFNVIPPTQTDVAIFVGSTSGDTFEGTLSSSGDYKIRVYLMRSAARRNETANYTLTVSIAGKAASTARDGSTAGEAHFDKTLDLQGIQFHVTSVQEDSLEKLLIAPVGLQIDNSAIVRTIAGKVTGAEVADLNVDGSPEIYVYLVSADGQARGSLVAYSANNRKSLSEIHLAAISDNKAAAKGYYGHDEFAVVESSLVRRFPIYSGTGADAKPTGAIRQLQYKLARGEAGWFLRVDRVVEY